MTSISPQPPDTLAELPPTESASAEPVAVALSVEPLVDPLVEPSVATFIDPSPAAAAEVAPVHLSPAECAEHLKRLFPKLFTGPAKPLKLRIQADIQQRAPGLFTKQSLSAFLRRYTGSHGYLLALSKGTQRFDLDGAPAGELSAEHRQVAADELARRRDNQQSRRELEEQQRRNRAQLLHDFERTTLTPANFCALKGIGVDELDGYLALAREEAKHAPPPERRPDTPPLRHAHPPERGGRPAPPQRPAPRQRPR